MGKHPEILAKSEKNGTMSLYDHLNLVAISAKRMAPVFNINENTAYNGAIIHDIGKANPEFQMRLTEPYSPEWEPFRELLTIPEDVDRYRNHLIEIGVEPEF